MITLRGVTWDHPRAVDSIRSASDAFHAANPDVVVEWVARPLHEFEDVPIEELAGSFDLLALDHPFMGDAAEHRALMPLNDLIPAPELGARAEAYVGQSYESYTWNGLQLALPVDAACMVSAFRPDRIDHTTLPKKWSDAADFIRNLDSGRTLMAANPTHLWCTFLTLCEAVSGASSTTSSTGPVWWTEGGIDEAIFAPAIDLLRGLLAVSSPLSLHSDPIAVLNLLASDGDFDYCPLVFEYSTYSLERDGFGLIEFANGPSGDDPTSGPLTGGVGLAVSALSAEPLWAARFAMYATSNEIQAGLYSRAGGQPAARAAWQDPEVNKHAHAMYYNTAASMDTAFLRPRGRNFPAFQRAAAAALHAMTIEGQSGANICRELNRMWVERAIV